MSTVNFAPLLKLLEVDSCTLVGRNSALGYMYMHMYMYMWQSGQQQTPQSYVIRRLCTLRLTQDYAYEHAKEGR